MKRILAIAIAAVIMLVTIVAPAGALAHGHEEEVEPYACLHQWEPAGYSYHPIYIGGDYGCKYSRYKLKKCKNCDARMESYVDVVVRNHDNEYAQDGGHNFGTRTHTFYQICKNCRYRTNYTVPCAGPPCTVPSSIQYELY